MPCQYDITTGKSCLQLGDILISDCAPFGHGGIVYDEKNVVHAVNAGIRKDSIHSFPNRAQVFRLSKNIDENTKKLIMANMDAFTEAGRVNFTTYSMARAVFKVMVGDSSYGSNANARLLKYENRIEHKTPKNVTCCELVTLCFQINMRDNDVFIKKDAKHVRPKSLRTFLNQSAQWQHIGHIRTRM